MKSFTICPMRGPGLSHMQGTKVTLAGRTTYLPNYESLLRSQRLWPLCAHLPSKNPIVYLKYYSQKVFFHAFATIIEKK